MSSELPRVISGFHRPSPINRPPTDKLTEGCQEAVGAFNVGHVAAVGYEGEGTFWKVCDRRSCLRVREHPVARPPDDERRNLQAREPIQEHLALTSRVHYGAEHAQVGFQVAWGERQPALSSQPLTEALFTQFQK